MRAPDKSQESVNPLDEVRINEGINKLMEFFHGLVARDLGDAIKSLNREDLRFPSLFALLKVVEELGILDQLSERNRIAIEIVEEILSPKNARATENETPTTSHRLSMTDRVQMVHSVLRWILETGSGDVELGDEYSRVLDTTVALLTRVFRDKTVLSLVVDMIFARAEKGVVIHYLIWAFFEARDPYSLMLIADHLRSPKTKERELARRLLEFVPGIELDRDTGEQQYWAFQRWLEENGPFLYFKGETFDQTTTPVRYAVVLRAKYIGRFVSVDSGEIVGSLTDEEHRNLEEFEGLREEAKARLAVRSASIRRRNLHEWYEWFRSPLKEQLRATN